MSRSVVRRIGGRVAIVAAVAAMVSLVLVPPAFATTPVISSVDSSSAPPGCPIAITGNNFQSPLVSDVKFGATPASSFVVKSDTLIFAMVENPGSLPSSAPITVINASGTSNSFAFTVTATGSCLPTVTSFSPASGPANQCWLTINGTNLAGAELTNGDVVFDPLGTPTSATNINVVSQTKIEAQVPAGATDGLIRVTTYVGSGDSAGPFNEDLVGCDPSIVSFSPGFGPAGTAVSITGANFLGATSVDFFGTNAGFVVLDASHINAFVPAGAATGPIHVTTAVDTATSVTDFIVGSGPPIPVPDATGISPSSGNAGTVVTITGSNLSGVTSITFDGTPGTGISNNTSGSVQVTVPAISTGTKSVVVTTAGGSDPTPLSFTVTSVAAPNATSMSPTSGGVGTTVTITGTNLSNATVTFFNGVTASCSSNTATQIVCTVPNGAATGTVNVTTAGGTDPVGTFTVIAAPNATTMTPTSGPVGTQVTITGTNLSNATVRFFNGVVASCSSNTATQIVCTVPNGATTGSVTVQTAGGTDTVGTFTVTVAVPTVTGFSPSSGEVGDLVSITGTNFVGTTVRFGLINASFTLNSSTSITATVPAGAGTSHISVTTTGGTGTSGLEFVVNHPRSVSLHFSKASGSVSVLDGWSQCGSIVPVRIQHKVNGQWRNVFQGFTNSNGSYSFAGITDPGKYRVIAKKFTTAAGDVCLKDKSPTATL